LTSVIWVNAKVPALQERSALNCGSLTTVAASAENLDQIFELFFTTKHAHERTGSGLCVVERVVSQLAGKARVESKLGKGSTFCVTLPNSGVGM